MSGAFSPTTSRLPPTEKSLRAPALDLLQGIFGNGGGGGTSTQNISQRLGLGANPAIANAFAAFLQQPSAADRTNAAQLSMSGGLGGASDIPGFDVLSAAGPVFNRNLTEALQRQQQSGPRFASTNAREGTRLQQQGLQDFNQFAQQTLETGRQRQLAGILGASQYDVSSQQNQLAALMPLLQALFGGGLSGGQTVGPSPFGQFAQLGSTAASLYLAGKKPPTGG